MTSQVENCRLCGSIVNGNCKLLFDPWSDPFEGMEATIADNLNKLTNIQVSTMDTYSKVICDTCYHRLLDACQFVHLVQENDIMMKLNNVEVDRNKNWPQPIQIDKTLSIFDTEVEIKQEVVSDDEYIVPELNTDYSGGDFGVKVEQEELVTPQITATYNGLEAAEIIHSGLPNGNGQYPEVEYLDDTVKVEPLSEDEDRGDLPTECMLCSKKFKRVSGLKAHVIAQHSYKSVKRKDSELSPKKPHKNNMHVCTTCHRSFTTSTDLMVHATCHYDTVCYACNMNFDSFERLSNHRRRCKASKRASKLITLNDVLRPQEESRRHSVTPKIPATPMESDDSISSTSRDATKTQANLQSKTCEISEMESEEPNTSAIQEMPVPMKLGEEKMSSDIQEMPVPMKLEAKISGDVQGTPVPMNLEETKMSSDIQEMPVPMNFEETKISNDIQEMPVPVILEESKISSEIILEIPIPMKLEESIDAMPPEAKLTCPTCDEKFDDIYYMNIHKEIHNTSSNNELSSPNMKSVSMRNSADINCVTSLDNLESIFGN